MLNFYFNQLTFLIIDFYFKTYESKFIYSTQIVEMFTLN